MVVLFSASAILSTHAEAPASRLDRAPSSPLGAVDAPLPSDAARTPLSLASRRLAGFYPASPVRVIDGDTVEMRVSIWLGQDLTTRVRMRDIDAPELKARCQEERVGAEAAKQRLEALLQGESYYLTDVGYDKYGTRVVARIVDAAYADLGAKLLDEKLARPYKGGKRQGWCGDALANVFQ